jgi:hypothetical protein
MWADEKQTPENGPRTWEFIATKMRKRKLQNNYENTNRVNSSSDR